MSGPGEGLAIDETAPAYARDPLIARADPRATISPAALEVARTFASLSPPKSDGSAPPLPDLPRLVVALAEPPPGAAPDIVITRELGQGGMGCVHLARQTVFDRTVAVKRVRPDRLCDEAVRALLGEARLAGGLDHPNIVPVHLLGQSDVGEPVLVMKRVEGVAWRALAAADARPEALRGDRLARHLEILRQVCNAVEFAHRHGVIHRDIKLENVMVGDLGEVYLLDWGVATRAGAPPSTELVGTPAYMAPEMIPGSGQVTARTDVYLLGATLHEILTGSPRHEGTVIWAVLGDVMRSDPFEYGPEVPAELAAIANRATARDPGDRFPSALAFGEAVGEFLRHRGSLDLSDEAERLLGELRAALQGPPDAADAERGARVRRTSMECAFGFRQALRAWPDNRRARDGLRACAEETVAFELSARNAPGAEALLAELDPPPPALVGALARLKVALVEEAEAREKLERIVRDQDVFLDGSTGGSSPAVFSAIIAAGCVGLSLAGVRMTNAGFVAFTAAMLAAAVAMLRAQRSALIFNRASARRVLGTTMSFPFNLVVGLVGWAQGWPAVQTVQMAMAGQALLAAVVGVTVTPVLLVGVPLYLAALAALVIWPREALFELGVLAALQTVANRAEAYIVRNYGARR